MGIFDGFFDNFISGFLNPKGNLGDARHASRTFVKNSFRLAPKVKFLYHVAFTFSPAISKTLPTWDLKKHSLEAGIIVKSSDLPSFSANIETKKKYNRTANVQTGLTYNPITISLHDDNLGIATGLFEAYYRYYYADGNYGIDGLRRAYNKSYPARDSTYLGAERNKYTFGLHNQITDPFFVDIQISQLSRHTYTTYTLVNPIVTEWKHGDVSSADGNSTNENTMTVAYETVWIDRGGTQDGVEPVGFADYSHYDITPSPNSLVGGGSVSLGATLSGAADLFDYALTGKGFNNPVAAVIAGINLARNTTQITQAGIEAEIEQLIVSGSESVYDNIVSGVPNSLF